MSSPKLVEVSWRYFAKIAASFVLLGAGYEYTITKAGFYEHSQNHTPKDPSLDPVYALFYSDQKAETITAATASATGSSSPGSEIQKPPPA